MATILILSGSPSCPSTTEALLDYIEITLRERGHATQWVRVRTLPAAPLLRGERDHPSIAEAITLATSADAVVIGSPVFKATYSGLLKVFVDMLPVRIFMGIPVLPILVGGSPAHVLALDFGIKPLLSTLGATSIGMGRFFLTSAITPQKDGNRNCLDAKAMQDLSDALDRFSVEFKALLKAE